MMLDREQTANFLEELQSSGIALSLPELLRYKALSSVLKLSPIKRSNNLSSGMDRSAFKGRGMEFDEARFYQPGDDIRSIDWRVTARTGKAHTKVFREERERPVFVFVDLSDSMQFGTQLLLKSVQAAHLASYIGFAAVGRGDKFGGVIFNQFEDSECKPKAQTKAVLLLIDQLIALQNQQTQHFKKAKSPSAKQVNEASLNALKRLNFIAKPGSLIHLISDFTNFEKAHFELLGSLSRHCEIMANFIYDPIELALPKVNSNQQLMVANGEIKQSITLGDAQKEVDYASQQNARLLTLKKQFSNIKTPLHRVNAAQPLVSQLSVGTKGFTVGELV